MTQDGFHLVETFIGDARPATTERDRALIQLRAAAPLRRPSGQHDVDGLGLFDAHRSPTLF